MDEFYKPQRQSPLAIIFILLKYGRRLFRLLLPLILLYFFRDRSEQGSNVFIFYLAGGIAIYQLLLSLVEYFRFFYHVEDDELVIERGVFSKKRISIPFERIQGINFEQNILHRSLNAVQFHVETAGSQGQEVSLEALSKDKAAKLRDHILETKEELDPEEPEVDQERSNKKEHKIERSIFRIELPTLLKIGLTANHIQTMGLIMGFLWGIYTYAEEIFRFKPEKIVDLYQEYVGYSIALFAIWFFASVFLSLIRTVFRYYGLRFWQYEAGFKWVAGLITRQERSAPYKKVQFMRWRTNPLRQLIGVYSLRLYVAGSATGQQSSSELPGSTREHIEAVQKILYPEAWRNFGEGAMISSKVIFRRILYFGVIPVLVASITFYFSVQWWSLLSILWLPISIWAARRYHRRWRYWINQDMIRTFSGIIGSKEILLPIYKVQAVTFSQTPYQVRQDLVTFNLSTAAGQLQIPYIEKDHASKLKDYILYRAEIEHRPWM